jgi:ABC-type multidrug transport system ATPase subunit/ABC-type multidrug transport system permease subunit
MVVLWAKELVKRFRPRLRVEDLLRARFRPGQSSTLALDGVGLEVEEGEIVAVLGPNGAGKTTLLKTLATLVMPDSGEAWIAGRPLNEEAGVRRSIGLVTSEERSFYWRLTGRQNLTFFAAMQGLEASEIEHRLQRLSSVFHLEPFIDRRFDSYSSGMKQRLAFVRALLHRPRLLLLDEPTRSVDPVESRALHASIIDLVRQEKTAVLLVTHDLHEAEALCQRFLIMQAGRITFDGALPELGRRLAQTGIQERFTLLLDRPVDGRDKVDGVVSAELLPGAEPATLSVRLAPDTYIGDVVAGIHARGVRVREVHSPDAAGVLESALESIGEPKGQTEQAEPGSSSPASSPPSVSPPPLAPVSTLSQFTAFFRRDVRIHLSYRFAFALGFVGMLFNVAVFYYLAQLITDARVPALERYGSDFFPFILIGIAFRGYLGVGLNHFAPSLRAEQMMGTLGMLLASPVKVSTLLSASAGFAFVYHSITVVGYLLIGLLMGSLSLDKMNFPVVIIIMVPTMASFSALGMLSAAFLMTFKRGDPVNFLINAAVTLFGGVYFPVEVLPESLRVVSYALPITYSLEAMRKGLLVGAGLPDVIHELGVLVGFAVVLMPLGLIAFRRALRQARKDGTLGQF